MPNKASVSNDKTIYFGRSLCSHLRRRVRTTLVVPNFCLGLGLLRHLRQAPTSGVDEPVTDLQPVSRDFDTLITFTAPLAYLANCEACLAHEDLLLLFGRVWVRDVFRKPHAQGIGDSLGQIASAALLFPITLLGRTVVGQSVAPTTTSTERRAIRVLTRGIVVIMPVCCIIRGMHCLSGWRRVSAGLVI